MGMNAKLKKIETKMMEIVSVERNPTYRMYSI